MPAKPKLLIAAKEYFPVIGGVETVVRDIATGCQDEFDTTVLVVNNEKRTVTERYGFNVLKVNRLAKIFSAPWSLEYLACFRDLAGEADIISVHSPYPLVEWSLIRSRSRVPVVDTYHFDIVRQKVVAPIYNRLLHSALGRADAIIVSNPNLERSSPILDRHRSRVCVIPYGIDLDSYALVGDDRNRVAELRRNYPRTRVLFVGRLVYYKGVENLIRAAPDVDADFVIVGEGRLESSLRKLATRLGVSDRVHFVPHLSERELRAHLHVCDVFVLPSIARSEAFGLVLLAAMACGKPLVSTELGTGTSWINQNDVTGLVVPPNDPSALAAAIRRIASSPELAHQFGQAGLRRAQGLFSRERFARSYVTLFRQLVGSSPASEIGAPGPK